MSFLAANRLVWLLVALPVIAFYILKPRLRRKKISTLLFWDQIFEEKRQRSLWQNLRHWLSLLLQLLFIAFLVSALVDPAWTAGSGTGQELILIIDNSASMQAVDPKSGDTRLSEAKVAADRLIQALRPGDRAAVLSAGSDVRVITGMTDFIPTLRESVESIAATDGPGDLNAAILAARRISPDKQQRRIVIVSDACDQQQWKLPPSDPAATEPPSTDESLAKTTATGVSDSDDVFWLQVGADAENVGITAFQARRSTVDPLGYALLVEVQNFSEEAVSCRLKLTLGDALVDVYPLQLEPGESWRKSVEATSESGGVLLGTLDVDDALAVDNTARAIVPRRPRIPVTLVKAEEDDAYYLTSVLEAIPLIDLMVINLAEYTATRSDESVTADSAPAGLTVFSGVVPPTLPLGAVLFVGPGQPGPQISADEPTALWELGPELDAPLIAEQSPDSPLLRHVRLQNVLLDGGRDIRFSDKVGPSTPLLKTADDAVVMVSCERTAGRILVLSSRLDASDLPLRIAFPVMMTNSVNWFLRQSNDIQPALATGQSSRIGWTQSELNVGTDRLSLISPDGERTPLQFEDQRVIVGPRRHTGVYGAFLNLAAQEPDASGETARETEGAATNGARLNRNNEAELAQELSAASPQSSLLLAVNLCQAAESDLRLPPLPEQQSQQIPASGLPLWLILCLVAGAFIVLEWVLFHRRIVA